MHLKREHIFASPAFAEIGQTYLARLSPDGRWLIVCSTNDHLAAPFKLASAHIPWLITVWDAPALRLVALRALNKQIRDVCRHPTLPLAAIAYGSYDGGFFFEGNLLIFNFTTMAFCEVFSQWLSTVRCAFSADGGTLDLVIEAFDDEEEHDLGTPLLRTAVSFDDWSAVGEAAVDPHTLERVPIVSPSADLTVDYDSSQVVRKRDATERLLSHIAAADGSRYETRTTTATVAVPPTGEVVASRVGVALEGWSIAGERRLLLPDERGAQQLLLSPDGESVYLAIQRGQYEADGESRLMIDHVRLADGARRNVAEVRGEGFVSIDAAGDLLVRDSAYRRHLRPPQPSRDYLIAADGQVHGPLDLGEWLGGLEANGGHWLYFLQGTPPRPSGDEDMYRGDEEPWVCRLEPRMLRADRLFPLAAHRSEHSRPSVSAAALLASEQQIALAMQAGWDNRGYAAQRSLPDGAVIRAYWLPAPVLALAAVPAFEALACVPEDGTLQLLSLQRQAVLAKAELSWSGVPTVGIAVAARENVIAVGTSGGSAITYRIESD